MSIYMQYVLHKKKPSKFISFYFSIYLSIDLSSYSDLNKLYLDCDHFSKYGLS